MHQTENTMSTILPKTSLDAYKSVTPEMLSGHYGKIKSTLEELKLATGEEIAKHSSLDYHQVMRRLKEMEVAEIIYKPGSKKNTSTGRQAFQYAIRGENVDVKPVERQEKITAVDFASKLIAQGKKTKKKLTPITVETSSIFD